MCLNFHQKLLRDFHTFLTYKGAPEEGVKPKVEITHVYNAEEAAKVIELASEDYKKAFSNVQASKRLKKSLASS